MKEVTVGHNQSVWDLAIQEGGSVDYLPQLLKDNPALNLETTPVPGSKILIDESKIIAKSVVDDYAKRKYRPASAVEVTECSAFSLGFNKGFR